MWAYNFRCLLYISRYKYFRSANLFCGISLLLLSSTVPVGRDGVFGGASPSMEVVSKDVFVVLT